MGNIESVDGHSEMKHHIMPLKVPMPDPTELEEKFAIVLNSMNLPPDKARLLRQYDNEKKWDLICDQERFQVKNPPHTYIQKLRGYLDPGVTRKKFRRRVQESTKVLRELEISLRTNHIGWVREFLNDENRGLDVLVEYLSFAQCAVMLDFEGMEKGEDGFLDKSWSRSIEDLHHTGTRPFCNTLVRSARQSVLRYGSVSNTKTIKNSRLVSQKDDVHVCIMCLRAIMNYQYGFNMVMSHEHAVNEIALSLNNKNSRTKALVLELLAAVCLVRGGHEIILSAFDNFKEVCKEKHRFERLMDYFHCEEGNIDFMVACMQFINIVVHSVEDMNFRVHLQYEFTKLGLDDYLEKSKHTESDKLSVQIQAYLDNVFDVGGLLEDAETKNAALEKVDELEEHLSHVSAPPSLDHQHCSFFTHLCDCCGSRAVYLTRLFLTWQLEILTLLLTCFCILPTAIRIKKPIKTKFRLPVFNWTALKPNQINGTVFNEIDDERVLEELDLEKFEELFKTRAQGPIVDLSCTKSKVAQKAANKVTLLDANRSKNLAITLRKANKTTEEICKAIEKFDLKALPVDFVECLMRFLPTDAEVKVLRQYERERRPLDQLAEEDRFMLLFSKIERLTQRMNIITFVGNFADSINMLTPQLNAIIAASGSVKSSPKLKRMLEIILALGNYMNSSKRGSVYGFKLQSLDLLLDTKSTDRKMTLLHYIALIVKEKYKELANFYNELHFVDKAAAGGFAPNVYGIFKYFCSTSVTFSLQYLWKMCCLTFESWAKEAFNSVVSYFGESAKTTPPSVFFPVFVRFIKAYKDAVEENELRKKQEEAMREKLLAQEAKQHDPKVQAQKKRQQQQELIAELRKRQAKDHRPVYEGKDGTIEDIITGGPERTIKGVRVGARSTSVPSLNGMKIPGCPASAEPKSLLMFLLK
uniref:Formin-like 3 n=1 Tax=Nothobranchius furzeri TaxID=105023 RepID=A0A8C6NXP8_NOTFU